MLKSGCLILALSLFMILARGQSFPCGTVVSEEQRASELAQTDSLTGLIQLNRTFHLSLFIVKDDKGQTNINITDIEAAVSQLNAAFEPISLNFALNQVAAVDNYHFDEIHPGTLQDDLVTQYYVHNTINVYLVSKLYNEAEQEVCGYTYFPSAGADIIWIRKSCLNGPFLTEQAGHFFNLYHTHETIFGAETASGSNCAAAGDRCCDTPADPLLTGKVLPDCQYNGTQKDPMGQYYVPTTGNFMSYSPLSCRCFFSEEQLIRMINSVLRDKDHLW
jgi:hypothetical protein